LVEDVRDIDSAMLESLRVSKLHQYRQFASRSRWVSINDDVLSTHVSKAVESLLVGVLEEAKRIPES
jgi:hypothetical protein